MFHTAKTTVIMINTIATGKAQPSYQSMPCCIKAAGISRAVLGSAGFVEIATCAEPAWALSGSICAAGLSSAASVHLMATVSSLCTYELNTDCAHQNVVQSVTMLVCPTCKLSCRKRTMQTLCSSTPIACKQDTAGVTTAAVSCRKCFMLTLSCQHTSLHVVAPATRCPAGHAPCKLCAASTPCRTLHGPVRCCFLKAMLHADP